MGTERNTLNDIQYTDANVARAVFRDGVLPTPVGPEYDHVLSVFKKVMKDDAAAANFTEALYRIAQFTEVYVLTLLEALDVADEMTISASMAYYLNGISSPSILHGVQNPVGPNYYAGRNVLS